MTDIEREPNFSIVLPGPCNAACDFCFWREEPVDGLWLLYIADALRTMPVRFRRLSLTGGEPMLSPQLTTLLSLINKDRWPHIVLTTNGTKLAGRCSELAGKVDHLNISRHHYDDVWNASIFRGSGIPNSKLLADLCDEANAVGIDVTLNCVLSHIEPEECWAMIDLARIVGASAVTFRKPHTPRSTVSPSPHELYWRKGYAFTEYLCPVCRSSEQLFGGIRVIWKAGVMEPSKVLDEAYEVIMHPSGALTTDWAAEIPFTVDMPPRQSILVDGSTANSVRVGYECHPSGGC